MYTDITGSFAYGEVLTKLKATAKLGKPIIKKSTIIEINGTKKHY